MSGVVFLVGAGRSGTTLLYKLLALHPRVRVITNYDVHFGRFSPAGAVLELAHRFPQVARSVWFSSGGAAHFQHGYRRFFPMPVEGEPVYASCGVPLGSTSSEDLPAEVAACLRNTFDRMQRSSGASVFITKRTANNRRLNWLREAFPDARFIHLMRDGRDVAHSLSKVRFWETHNVWWDGRKPREMEADGWEPLQICARNWVEDVLAAEQGLEGLPEDQCATFTYENLLGNWEETLTSVCEFLGLGNSESFLDAVRALDIRWREPKYKVAWTPEQLKIVESEQHGLLRKYGYSE
ncbi:MAG: sulfotransferase [Thiohalocapsa sp.]|nr:sulfotransferase [Thiohalocapsa sp.]